MSFEFKKPDAEEREIAEKTVSYIRFGAELEDAGLIGKMVGFLREDSGWVKSWVGFDFNRRTKDFEAERDALIDVLRDDGQPLQNRAELVRFCGSNRELVHRIAGGNETFIAKIVKDKAIYFLRLDPKTRFNNTELICFERKAFERGKWRAKA